MCNVYCLFLIFAFIMLSNHNLQLTDYIVWSKNCLLWIFINNLCNYFLKARLLLVSILCITVVYERLVSLCPG